VTEKEIIPVPLVEKAAEPKEAEPQFPEPPPEPKEVKPQILSASAEKSTARREVVMPDENRGFPL